MNLAWACGVIRRNHRWVDVFVRFLPIGTNFYKDWFNEFIRVENDFRALLPNGESVEEYLERVVNEMHRTRLFSDAEKQAWMKALRNEEGGKFVMPKESKAKEILYNTFFALSQKKPETAPIALLQSTSAHVQASGEICVHAFESAGLRGSFEDDPTKGSNQKSSLIGYTARTNYSGWQHLLEDIKDLLHQESADEVKRLLGILENVNEWSDLYKDISSSTLSDEAKGIIYGEMAVWINELRPTNYAVVESLGFDIVEAHLMMSYQMGDFEYFEAVRKASMEYHALKKAFETISKKSPDKREGWEKELFEKYDQYRPLVM